MMIVHNLASSLGIDVGSDSLNVLVFLSSLVLSSYALASLAVFGLIQILSADRLRDRALDFALAVCGGPMMLAWLLSLFLRLIPNQPAGFYVAAVSISLLTMALFGALAFAQTLGRRRVLALEERKKAWKGWLLALAAIVSIALFVLLPIVKLNLVLPVTANDALDYFTAARLVFEQKSLANYPFVDSSTGGGFYGYWTHPPGFVSVLAWSYFLQGHADFAGGARLTAVWHLAALLLLVGAFVARSSWIGACSAVLFLLSTPFFLENAIIQHVDTTRIAIFTAALVALIRGLESFTLRRAILVGLFLGLAQFVHSIGMLVLLLGGPLYLILRKTVWSLRGVVRRVVELAVIGVVGILVVSMDQAVNYQTYGTFLKDAPAVWSLDQLNVGEHREFVRMIATPMDRVINGLLRGFNDERYFSYTYFAVTLLALMLLIMSRRDILAWLHQRRHPGWSPSDDIAALTLLVAGFYGLVILSMAAGSDLIIKNGRYLATPHGLLACLFGLLLARFVVVMQPAMMRLIFGRGSDGLSLITLASKAFDNLRSVLRQIAVTLRSLRPHIVVTSFGGAVLLIIAAAVAVNIAASLQATKSARYQSYSIDHVTRRQSGAMKVTQAPNGVYRMIDHINQMAATGVWPSGEKVLSYRKSDAAFYLDVPFLAYLDEKLTPLYRTADIASGIGILRDLRVGYILAPRRAEPTFYNSIVQDIVGDPRLARLVKAESGFRLFELTFPEEGAQQALDDPLLEIVPNEQGDRAKWVVWDSGHRPESAFADLDPDGALVTIANERGLRRDNGNRTRAWSAICKTPVETVRPYAGAIPAMGGTYQLQSEISGTGYLRIWLWRADHFEEKDKCRLSSFRIKLWEGLLSGGDRRIVEQFISQPPPAGNRAWDVLAYELVDGGQIEIRNAVVRPVLPATASRRLSADSRAGR